MLNKIFWNIVALGCLGLTQLVIADEKADPFARDLLILTDWFEGEFDNEEQRWFEKDRRAAIPEEEHHVRLHTAHKRLDLPQFGEHVFYVEEYIENDPANIIRQRFVTFESDIEAGAIRMRQGFLKDAEAAKGAHHNPEKLSGLKKEDVFFMSDLDPNNQCDVFWNRVADQYEGKILGKSCVFGEEEKRRYSVHKMILSAEKYWRSDASYLLSDNSLHVGDPVNDPIRMRRADIFDCQASFRIKGSFTEVQEVEPFKMHNQGGMAKITRDSDSQVFEILLRSKEYPFYNKRPDFLYFSIRHEGAQRSLVYSVHDTDSRILGVNHNNMGVHCYREGYEFRESLQQL